MAKSNDFVVDKDVLSKVKLTKAGQPVEGDPIAGFYYKASLIDPKGDSRAIAKSLKALYPKSFFAVVGA